MPFVDPDRYIDVAALPEPAPCPFCGNHGESPIWLCHSLDSEGRCRFEVQCVKCHCTGPGAGEFSALDAATRWNVRGTSDWVAAGAAMGLRAPPGERLN